MNMEVKPVVSLDVSANATAVRQVSVAKEKTAETKPAEIKTDAEKVKSQGDDLLNRDDMEKITNQMTEFMKSLNTEIAFSIHEGTGRLVVKVMDKQTNTVLKEFPPHQLLDTLAAISEYIGGLLDKKA